MLQLELMIVGLGLDVVETSRIEEAMQNPRFLQRVLTPREQAICNTVHRVAGRWAAKEAVAKAVGLKLSWQDVEVLPDEDGKPVANVVGLPSGVLLHVTISHEKGIAAAVAILERPER
jgi:holo-[acyl-carrier protein] synthase